MMELLPKRHATPPGRLALKGSRFMAHDPMHPQVPNWLLSARQVAIEPQLAD
jgi:hypothetical protein